MGGDWRLDCERPHIRKEPARRAMLPPARGRRKRIGEEYAVVVAGFVGQAFQPDRSNFVRTSGWKLSMTPTILTQRFEQALVYAAILHSGQGRKGTAVPYISHVMSVAALALENGANEDEAIAALLHDAV